MADPPAAEAEAEPAFRKPKARANMRKRPASDDNGAAAATEADGDAGSVVVRPEKTAKPTPFAQSTRADRPRQLAEDVAAHASDRRITGYDNKVFATNEQETAHDRDARAIFERQKALDGDGDGDPSAARTADGDKVYRGANNYRAYTKRPEDFNSVVLSGAGPQRAPQHYRAVCRFDYQPDVCKDYKETGFCGYGDACKFMHDRGDYKTGWQLEREWDVKAKERQRRLDAGLPEEPADGDEPDGGAPPADELPFACLLCRKPWTPASDPVVTKCGHHFCEACACAHFAKSKRCAVCNELTHGTFNAAKKLREQVRARAASVAGVDAGGAEAEAEAEAEEIRRAPAREAARKAKASTVSAWQL
jgi:RING finger protein 113A